MHVRSPAPTLSLDAQFAVLVEKIYLGSQNSAIWNLALQTLTREVGAEFGFLLEYSADGKEFVLLASTDPELTNLRNQVAFWHLLSSEETPLRSDARTSKLIVSDPLRRPPRGGGPAYFCAGGVFGIGDDRIASFCVGRGTDSGTFRAADLTVISTIVLHMQCAMELRAARVDGERSANEIMSAMQAHGWGVAAISADGRILSTNRNLTEILSKSSDVVMRRNTLIFSVHSIQESYLALLNSLPGPTVDSGRRLASSIKVGVCDGHSVRVVQTGSFGAGVWCLPLETRAMLLFIPNTDHDTGEQLPAQELVDRYDCTPTEARIAIAMSRGARPELIAKARGVKVSTIRGHVKRIYAKLGVNRQAELMVRLHRVG